MNYFLPVLHMIKLSEEIAFLAETQERLRRMFPDPKDPKAYDAFLPVISAIMAEFPRIAAKYKKMEGALLTLSEGFDPAGSTMIANEALDFDPPAPTYE